MSRSSSWLSQRYLQMYKPGLCRSYAAQSATESAAHQLLIVCTGACGTVPSSMELLSTVYVRGVPGGLPGAPAVCIGACEPCGSDCVATCNGYTELSPLLLFDCHLSICVWAKCTWYAVPTWCSWLLLWLVVSWISSAASGPIACCVRCRSKFCTLQAYAKHMMC